jgi:glutathionylspermidine synthase
MSNDSTYERFAARIQSSGWLNDPWLDGRPRFANEPCWLSEQHAAELCQAGEDLAYVVEEAVQLLAEDDEQRAAFVPLLPAQALMWRESGARWHGIARADVFRTADGLQVTELNSDTPTGEPEAVVLGALAAAEHGGMDACASLPQRLVQLWRFLHHQAVDEEHRNHVAAIVYPTEFTEDLSLVRMYRQLLQQAGFQVVLGSPYNLEAHGDDIHLFGHRCSLIVRHYKTDWWGERQSVWRDDCVSDGEPLWSPLQALLQAERKRRCVVVNPFGSVVSQSKRVMAFCWERIHRFPTRAQRIIETLLPYTARLETMHEAQLLGAQHEWVLKSDYGAEGDEVVLGCRVTAEEWRACLQQAHPQRFVVQRHFQAVVDTHGQVANHGVFVIAGEACGLYTRTDTGPTDPRSLSRATLIASKQR